MRKNVLLSGAAASALLLTAPLSASAQGWPTPTTAPPPAVRVASQAASPKVTIVNNKVIAPFSIAVSKGHVFVADGGTGKISQLVRGSLRTIATGPSPQGGGDVAGLAASANGPRLAYTTTADESHKKTTLEIVGPYGSRVSADLSGYEAKVNPDKNKLYGIPNPNKCVSEFFAEHAAEVGPVNYKGQVDSHPYAVASVGKHWVVADAGGNDLLKVDAKGKVSTLAVLPRQALKITATVAQALGAPACAVGFTYFFEAVPTDVEVGAHGWLYVSVLAGGPEGPAFGPRSKVYRVNPRTGHATKVGSHLSGATNIALKGGKIYVAELFGGRISVLKGGRPKTYAPLARAVSLESARHGFWAGTMAPTDDNGAPTGTGSIVRIK